MYPCHQARKSCAKTDTVVFDIDGTLLDIAGIKHLIDEGAPTVYDTYRRFHEASVDSDPHEWVLDRARDYRNLGFKIVLLTARAEMWRPHTMQWIECHDVPCDLLVMRAARDPRPDDSMKLAAAKRLMMGHHLVHAFDDKMSVVQMWHGLGVPVTVVPGGQEG